MITLAPTTKQPTNDALKLELRPAEQKRYEEVKRWREQQIDPHYTELPKGHPLTLPKLGASPQRLTNSTSPQRLTEADSQN